MTNYKVNHSKKKIYADIPTLTEQEKKEIKNYLDLGYILAPKTQRKTEEEKEIEKAEKENKPYTKAKIEKFLNEKGNEKYLKEYEDKKDELAGTPDKPKYDKNGKPKKKGFINGLRYFRTVFTYNEKTGKYEKN